MFNKYKYMYLLHTQKELYKNIAKRKVHKPRKVRDKVYMIKVNRRISNLIIRSVAFTIRSMWYYRVEDISVWEYFDKEDFDKSYNDLRYFLLCLDMKCEKLYKNYENFKVFVDKK